MRVQRRHRLHQIEEGLLHETLLDEVLAQRGERREAHLLRAAAATRAGQAAAVGVEVVQVREHLGNERRHRDTSSGGSSCEEGSLARHLLLDGREPLVKGSPALIRGQEMVAHSVEGAIGLVAGGSRS